MLYIHSQEWYTRTPHRRHAAEAEYCTSEEGEDPTARNGVDLCFKETGFACFLSLLLSKEEVRDQNAMVVQSLPLWPPLCFPSNH